MGLTQIVSMRPSIPAGRRSRDERADTYENRDRQPLTPGHSQNVSTITTQEAHKATARLRRIIVTTASAAISPAR
jgi:hypothetical protein